DAVCDSQKLIRMNIKSAQAYGAEILTDHAVLGFEITNNKIQAIHIVDIRTGNKKIIPCQFVINAAGAWADKIANMASIPFSLTRVKGSMLVMHGHLINTVLNRCHPPGDGDIILS